MDTAPDNRPSSDEAVQSLLKSLRPDGTSQLAPLETFYQAGFAAGLKAAEAGGQAEGASRKGLAAWLHPSSFSSGALAGVVATVLLMVWWLPGQQPEDRLRPVDLVQSPPRAQPDAPRAMAVAERDPSDANTSSLTVTEADSRQLAKSTTGEAGGAGSPNPNASLLGALGRSLLGIPLIQTPTGPLQADPAWPEPRYSIIAGGLKNPLLIAAATQPSGERMATADNRQPSATTPADEPVIMLRMRSQLTDVEL